jgi:hypothetical protein
MTYRVVFHAKADAETFGLPAEAFTALIETLAVASRDPGRRKARLARHQGQGVLQNAVPVRTAPEIGAPDTIGPGLPRHLLGQLRRATCWDEEEPR